MDIEWIRQGLKKPGKTQRGIAQALGIDPSGVNRLLKGGRELKASEIEKIKSYLEDADVPNGLQFPSAQAPVAPDASTYPRDVPLHSGALCGENGAFEFESQISDFAPRPPRLKGVQEAYALYTAGESMSPWREPGQIVYVHPRQPWWIGDYVVILLRPRHEGDPPEAYIKKLVGQNVKEIRVMQYNPMKYINFQRSRIQAVHRIMDWPELMGA